MRKRWGFLFGLVCWAWSAALPVVAVPATGYHCLWTIRGQHNTVFLLGSVHFLRADDYPLAPAIEGAFRRSKVVVFETDLNQLEQPEVRDQLLDQSRLPAGQTLRDVLSPGAYARLNAALQAYGLRPGILDNLKPAIAALTLQTMAMQKVGFNPDYGIDQHFFGRAHGAGKSVLSLETPDQQMKLLTGLSRADGELLVETTLESLDSTRKFFGEMMRAWRTGDTPALADLLQRVWLRAPSLFDRLVAERTRCWVPAVEALLDRDEDALMVVGAGHLVGPQGLLALLRQRGFEPVQE